MSSLYGSWLRGRLGAALGLGASSLPSREEEGVEAGSEAELWMLEALEAVEGDSRGWGLGRAGRATALCWALFLH